MAKKKHYIRKNKTIMKDKFGTKWWVNTKNHSVTPTNWKLQAILESLRTKT